MGRQLSKMPIAHSRRAPAFESNCPKFCSPASRPRQEKSLDRHHQRTVSACRDRPDAAGAYNINNLEQTVGLFREPGLKNSNEEPVDPAQAPFIIQISKGARKYTDKRMLEAIIRAAGEIFPDAIFAVHLDHGDEETCYDCIDSGFYSSVMIDASHEPFDKNVEITKRVVDRAHARALASRPSSACSAASRRTSRSTRATPA